MNLMATLMSEISAACSVDQNELSLETKIDEIGLDSFSLVRILTTIESQCGIELSEQEVALLLEATLIADYLNIFNRALARHPSHA